MICKNSSDLALYLDHLQVVLINVNTNDFNCGNQPGQQYVQDYTTLVQVRLLLFCCEEVKPASAACD